MHHVWKTKNFLWDCICWFCIALLTRLAVVNYDTDSTPMRVLIKADWSDNNSTLAWKNPNDIRSFHLQVCWSINSIRFYFSLVIEYCLSWWYSIRTFNEYIRLFTWYWFIDGTWYWTNEKEYWNIYGVSDDFLSEEKQKSFFSIDIWCISLHTYQQSRH